MNDAFRFAKILIVDDEPVIRESFSYYLEDRDYIVFTAENGLEGLGIFKHESPDLVLTDLRMPEMDGIELMKQCKAIAPDKPIIVISGANRIDGVVDALRYGATDYLVKPVENLSILEHAVTSALEKARLVQENEAYQENLEQLVRDRTEELNKANIHLSDINTRLRKIVETTQILTVHSDIKKFSCKVLDEFSKHMMATGGSIYFIETDGLRLLHTLDSEHMPEFIPFPLSEKSVLKKVIDEKRSLLIKDINLESKLVKSGWDGYSDGSLLAFPLPDERGKIIGVLTLHGKKNPPFLEQDLEIGSILASYTSETLRAIRVTETLQVSEKRYRELAEMLPEVLIETDSDLKLLYVNQRTFKLFGYSDMLLKRDATLLDLLIPSDRIRLKENLILQLNGMIIGSVEYKAIKKNKSSFPILLSMIPTIKNREVIGYKGIIVDISDRKEAELELQKFKLGIDRASDAFFITNRDGLITYINPAFTKIYGYSFEEAVGETPRILKSNTLPKEVYEDFWRDLLAKKAVLGEIVNKRKDGKLLNIEGTNNPILNSEGDIIGFLGIHRDITERIQAEKEKENLETQLRRSQKLETIGTLAGGIAHDFNNILTPILGFSEMAMEQLSPVDKIFKDLEYIYNGANRAKDLVEQILLFSKQTEKEQKPLLVQIIAKEALKLLRPSIPVTVDIKQNIDSSCSPILADATQIHQVIMNICTNAWQAMQEKGGIFSIVLKEVTVDEKIKIKCPNLVEGKHILLSIADTGPGMSEEVLEHIFEPFFTTKAVDKGTGLGLSVVHGIVRNHKGDIFVQSKPGKGTTFEVYIPVIKMDKEHKDEHLKTVAKGNEKILLVDDEIVITEMLTKMLKHFGYSVTVFNSGFEALEFFKENIQSFDLLITDLSMPKMTGIELIDQLHNYSSELPVLLLSGFGEIVNEEEMKSHGITKFLTKPISMKEFASEIRKILDGI